MDKDESTEISYSTISAFHLISPRFSTRDTEGFLLKGSLDSVFYFPYIPTFGYQEWFYSSSSGGQKERIRIGITGMVESSHTLILESVPQRPALLQKTSEILTRVKVPYGIQRLSLLWAIS